MIEWRSVIQRESRYKTSFFNPNLLLFSSRPKVLPKLCNIWALSKNLSRQVFIHKLVKTGPNHAQLRMQRHDAMEGELRRSFLSLASRCIACLVPGPGAWAPGWALECLPTFPPPQFLPLVVHATFLSSCSSLLRETPTLTLCSAPSWRRKLASFYFCNTHTFLLYNFDHHI